MQFTTSIVKKWWGRISKIDAKAGMTRRRGVGTDGIMGQEALREAKEHPEKYGDLVVSGRLQRLLVDLSPAMQDEIIALMEHVL